MWKKEVQVPECQKCQVLWTSVEAVCTQGSLPEDLSKGIKAV